MTMIVIIIMMIKQLNCGELSKAHRTLDLSFGNKSGIYYVPT